jgi:voltage-gated potassium channel
VGVSIIVLVLLLYVWGIPFSRVNEIFYAFLRDGRDRIRGDERPKIPLDAVERIVLAARSYRETTVNFGLIYYLLFDNGFSHNFRDVFEAIYVSGVTITTLGYGDIVPRTFIPQMMSVYEVFVGFVLVIVAFGAYLGGQGRGPA